MIKGLTYGTDTGIVWFERVRRRLTMTNDNYVKMTVNMSKENMESAKNLADKKSTTVTDIINRAVVLEKFFDEKKTEGAKILVKNSDGSMVEVFLR